MKSVIIKIGLKKLAFYDLYTRVMDEAKRARIDQGYFGHDY